MVICKRLSVELRPAHAPPIIADQLVMPFEVEPIGAEAPWTRATAVYALFGDVRKVNGVSRYAVIDDRGDHVKDEIQNLLHQVGSLVYWSDRVPWMERVAR